jgi:hypothetical protein
MMDLIVSEDATDLDTATRITHRAEMARPQVRRMQKFGHWRDVPLSMPQPSQSADQRAKDDVSGVRPFGLRPQDIPYCIYETTCDQVLADYGISDPHADSDLPVSYAVTLERDTRQVLDIRRRWKFGDEEFERKQQFVHYGMIPALGFLCLAHPGHGGDVCERAGGGEAQGHPHVDQRDQADAGRVAGHRRGGG